MYYEQATKLKDLGFSQEDLGGYNFGEDLNYPILKQLIDSIDGEHFELSYNKGMKWLAKGGEKYTAVLGDTPEESVANLWIELNS